MSVIFDIEEFYESGDGDNWTPAFMRAQLSAAEGSAIEVRLSGTQYRCEERIDIIRSNFSIVGIKRNNRTQSANETSAAIPTLYFPNGTGGIDVMYPTQYGGGTYGGLVVDADSAARGTGAFLSSFSMRGPGEHVGNFSDHGIRLRSYATLENLSIRAFRGDGVRIDASVPAGNANASIVRKVAIYECGGYGSWVGGGDVNQTRFDHVTYTGNGADLRGRGGVYTVVLGQEVDIITINDALPSTLYRLVVGGINVDHTTPSSGQTTATIAAALAAQANSVLTNQDAAQIRSNQLAIWGNNNANFTCTTTGSVGSMTVLEDVTTTASPQVAYCFNGPTLNGLRQNDNCWCYVSSGSYRGWMHGDITQCDETYGFLEVSTSGDVVRYFGDSITVPAAGTGRIIISDYRGSTGPSHIGRTIDIYGSAIAANNGSFVTTNILNGLYGATSVGMRVTYAAPGDNTYLIINGTRVDVTLDPSDTTLTLVRDRIIAAVTAAAVSGVTASIVDSDQFAINGTDVIVAYGPYLTEVGGTVARTVIDYTNANVSAEATWPGQWSINARVGVRGVYSGFVVGQICQVLDLPLIGTHYSNCLVNGDDDGYGYYNKSGYSVFDNCYTEGYLQSPMLGPAEVRGGQVDVPTGRVHRQGFSHDMSPSVEGGLLRIGDGAIRGTLGDESYAQAAIGWRQYSDVYGDLWRVMKAFTAKGSGAWEWILQAGTINQVALALGALDNVRLGPGAFEVAQPDFFVNYRGGSPDQPRNVLPNGANGATFGNDSMTGRATMLGGGRQNGSYACRFETQSVTSITSISGTTPPLVGIGTHNLPTGARGRCIIRNYAGTVAFGGNDHQWSRHSTTQVSLQDFSGTDRTLSGSYTSNTGIAILGRLIAYGYAAGNTLSLSDGSWCVGDRFINTGPLTSGDATEWLCTASGVGSAATWVPLYAIP